MDIMEHPACQILNLIQFIAILFLYFHDDELIDDPDIQTLICGLLPDEYLLGRVLICEYILVFD